MDVDLDEFRAVLTVDGNIADTQLKVLGLSPVWRDEAWLTATATSSRRPVFARSLAHHGAAGFWEECFRLLGESALFVGTSSEHAAFCREFGPVERQYIYGKAVFRYWPVSKMGTLD